MLYINLRFYPPPRFPPFHPVYVTVSLSVRRNGHLDHSRWRRPVGLSALASINVVNLHRARLLHGWVTLLAGKAFRYVTNHLGQLSLPSIRG